VLVSLNTEVDWSKLNLLLIASQYIITVMDDDSSNHYADDHFWGRMGDFIPATPQRRLSANDLKCPQRQHRVPT
jgi:hypothetical protein